jgi:hypothetical protein
LVDDFVVEGDGGLLDSFVLEEEAVVVCEGGAVGVAEGGLDGGVAQLALQVADHLQVELPAPVPLHRQRSQRTRTVPLYELPLEHLHRPQQRLVVVGDVPHLFIEELDGLVGGPELLVGCESGERGGVQLFLQADDLLLEDQD